MFYRLITLLVLSLFLIACGGEQKQEEAQPSPQEEKVEEQEISEGIQEIEGDAVSKVTEEQVRNTVVYFDFDMSNIKEEFIDILDLNALYLANINEATVVLEGHADERGTKEYNLALGERRAQAIRDYLVENGVDSDRIEVISFGEDRPAMEGSNEESWDKNRRVEFKY